MQVAFAVGAEVQPPVYIVAKLMRRKAAGLPDAMPSGDESSALAVGHFRDAPLDDVRAQFEQLTNTIIEHARMKTDDEMNAAGSYRGRRAPAVAHDRGRHVRPLAPA